MDIVQRACFLLLLLVFSAPFDAFAQRNLNVAAQERVALVIGNSAYSEAPLANPVNDASDMAKALQSAGFKVILRRNSGTREMRQAIREFATDLRRAEVGLFYFAGHGIQIKGANYLIPVATDINNEADVEDLAIDANYVLRTMEESQVKVSIVVLDACRNNPFARSFRSASRGLAQMNAASGSLVAFATAPGSVAADGTGRNGVYTKHLLSSLRQPDSDVLKVFQRTRAGVVKETGGRQIPWESTSLIGDFYFGPAGAAATAAPVASDQEATERSFWDSIKSSLNPEDHKAYLEQYPNGRFASLARNRLKPAQPPVTQVAAATPSKQQKITPGGKMQVDVLTNVGAITIELYPEKAPKTVENFIQYVKEGHYNGTIFHRVIPGFMVQGGGMKTDMSQKPTRPPIPIESKNGLKNQIGTLAMARTSDPNSATSQFFVNISDNGFLDYPGQDGNGYTVFGKVVNGMDVVNKIASTPTGTQGMHRDVPRTPILIESASVVGGK